MARKSEPYLKLYTNFFESDECQIMDRVHGPSGGRLVIAIFMTLRRSNIADNGAETEVVIDELARMAGCQPDAIPAMLDTLAKLKGESFTWEWACEEWGQVRIAYPKMTESHADLIANVLNGRKPKGSHSEAIGKPNATENENGGEHQQTNKPTNQGGASRKTGFQQSGEPTPSSSEKHAIQTAMGTVRFKFGEPPNDFQDRDLRKVLRAALATYGQARVNDAILEWAKTGHTHTYRALAENLDALCRGTANRREPSTGPRYKVLDD